MESQPHASAEPIWVKAAAAGEAAIGYPKELIALGIREYREVFFKPYRMICRVIGRDVYVYLIADDRRDMQSLLAGGGWGNGFSWAVDKGR